ncbi:hypothetical protein SLEP1_g50428 [Rubroshorea leprosula]|uniref:AtpF n=1 Tax=Rubroshorea leprosula TaxID=152421 RepID=A0AAV5M2I4_9ROSI|nr:hypothetical protein SLEP1_g50428 [Rubroshorea leprosula]
MNFFDWLPTLRFIGVGAPLGSGNCFDCLIIEFS